MQLCPRHRCTLVRPLPNNKNLRLRSGKDSFPVAGAVSWAARGRENVETMDGLSPTAQYPGVDFPREDLEELLTILVKE